MIIQIDSSFLFFSFLMKTHSTSWAYLPDLTCWQAGGEFVYLSIFLDFDAIIWICCQFSLLSRSLEWNMFYQHGSLLGVQKRSSYYMPMCAWVWEFLHLITRKCEFSGNQVINFPLLQVFVSYLYYVPLLFLFLFFLFTFFEWHLFRAIR